MRPMGMQQLSKQKLSRKQRIYTIASTTWTITSWIWTAIIIVFLLQFIPAYLLSNPNSPSFWQDAVGWLNNNVKEFPELKDFPGNALRILAIIAIPLLAGITILAWMLKRNLREEPEGLDRLIKILEYDNITPQLENLQEQFRQLLQIQASSVNALSWIGNRLQQMPTTTNLKDLQTMAYRQEPIWKKTIDQALQDIHTRTIEQAGWLGDLFQQSQHTEKTISADLHAIVSILEQLRDKVEVASLLQQVVSEAKSDQFVMAEPSKAVVTPPSLDQLKPSSTELMSQQFPEFLKEPKSDLAAHDDNQSLRT
jgi:hypothetical protein